MKITTITRLISGYDHDNVSATAELNEGENVIEAFKELHNSLTQALTEINLSQQVREDQAREKGNTISLLEDALKYAKDRDIPF